jgi:hypothetical protein
MGGTTGEATAAATGIVGADNWEGSPTGCGRGLRRRCGVKQRKRLAVESGIGVGDASCKAPPASGSLCDAARYVNMRPL